VDAPSLPPSPASDPPGYVYAATDLRPRQTREIELCKKASDFDWLYTGTMFTGALVGLLLSSGPIKQGQSAPVRLLGPATSGFFWGGFLSGGYLALPKCDPLWAGGPPPEGDIRASWPMALTIAMVSIATAPAMDYIFLGPVPSSWPVPERSARVFVSMGASALGALFPYVVPPKTWAARQEIDRIRVMPVEGGAVMGWSGVF
jgi:hypothetical protein